MKPGRNDPCPCGSGKKYKHCCANLSQTGTPTQQPGREPPKEPTANEQNQLIALYQARRYVELENQTNLLLKHYPVSGFGWKILSGALSMQGKDAFHALQQASILLPQDAPIHNNLGDLQAKREMLAEAEASFRKALRIKPAYADAHYNLGQVLVRQERYLEAINSLRQAIDIQPDNVDALLNLGFVLRCVGLHDEAVAKLRLAQKLSPDSVEVNNSLGGELAEQGNFEEASIYCRRALAINPEYVASMAALVAHKKIQPNDEDFVALLKIEAKASTNEKSLSIEERTRLNFALGKCFDDIKEYDQAFHHFAIACKLKRSTFQYDGNVDTQMFAEIRQAFSAENVDRLRGSGVPDKTPIFVLGMPRSGTTLTEQIIASHPDVHGAGELQYLLDVSQRTVAGIPYPGNLRQLERKQLTAWGQEYLSALKRLAPNAVRITDKMPQNFQMLGLIHLMLPNAKIIHVKRNPIDTCLSCFTMNFIGKNIKFSYDLRELAEFYVEYAGMMEHWRQILPTEAFIEVQYEDIVADQETQARRLIEYCGLEWNDACIDFHKTERSVRTASVAQVRKPVYTSSIERWRRYEKHLPPLLEVLGDLVPNR